MAKLQEINDLELVAYETKVRAAMLGQDSETRRQMNVIIDALQEEKKRRTNIRKKKADKTK